MTAPVAMNHCPTEETLAAFIDDRLDRAARQRVIEHMAVCGDCRDLILTVPECLAAAGDPEAPATPASGGTLFRFTPRAMFSAAAILAAAAVLIVVFGPMVRESPVGRRDNMGALISASAALPSRPIRARLSGDFPYRRYVTLRSAEPSGAETETPAEELALLRAHMEIQEITDKAPTVEHKHALGVSFLLLRKPEQARQSLEDALTTETGASDALVAIRQSHNAQLLNDFAAVCQTLIEKKEQVELRPMAVEAVQRAWSLAKTPSIAFTRALVIESVGVRDDSVRAWNEYLVLDAVSDWSVEAKERLEELSAPTDAELWPAAREELFGQRDPAALRATVDRFPQQVRLWCEDELLPQWGQAVMAGDTEAVILLSQIAAVGRALRDSNGERDVVDSVGAIRAANEEHRLSLARGHIAYGRGRKAIVDSLAGEALREMEAALRDLGPERTPFASRARVEYAAAVFLTNDYARALEELKRADDGSGGNVFNARAAWLRGIASSQMGAVSAAVTYYKDSIYAFHRAGESDHECMIHSLLASTLENAGQYAEADGQRTEAIRLLSRTGNPARRHLVMFEAAYAAISRDAPALADLLLDFVVAEDVTGNNAFAACTSLLWRSAYRFRRGLREPAQRDLFAANQFCSAVGDRRMRERAMANFGLARATLLPGQMGRRELEDLDRSVAYFRKNNNGRWLRTAYVARGRAAWAVGEPAAAEQDFRAALAEVKTIRREIDQRDSRVSFTATADDITDTYVDFLIQQERPREAFEVSDVSRSRESVDAPGARWTDDSSAVIARAQALLPPNAAVVEYRIVGDQVVAWVLTRTGFSTTVLGRTMSELKSLIDSFDAALSPVQFRSTAAALHDALLRPLAASLGTPTVLIFIPDGDLERVPFSALYNPGTGKYLLQDHVTLVAPSVRLFLQSVRRWQARRRGDGRMAIIEAVSSDSRFDALPDAAQETRSIARLFPRAATIDEPEALAALTGATYVHFSGHTATDGKGTTHSIRLNAAGTAIATPSQILLLPLTQAGLVYLSACDTDDGPIFRSEGALTVARSFFAAGVPVVIGTLWPVDDATSRKIAIEFYSRLQQNTPPAEALREAQLHFLTEAGNARPDWAAFRLIGGGIELRAEGTSKQGESDV